MRSPSSTVPDGTGAGLGQFQVEDDAALVELRGPREHLAAARSTTMESPSKTSSSWPPVMARYAVVQPASWARLRTSSRRVSSFSRSYGEALTDSSSPAPALRAAGTRPPSCHRSSQIASATSTPCTRTTGSVSPGTK